MEYVLLLIGVTFAFSLGLGFLLEKYLRMPWMFSALFLGIIFSSFCLFKAIIQDETLNALSTMGMLFLLFMIGFNLEIGPIVMRKIYQQSSHDIISQNATVSAKRGEQ